MIGIFRIKKVNHGSCIFVRRAMKDKQTIRAAYSERIIADACDIKTQVYNIVRAF